MPPAPVHQTLKRNVLIAGVLGSAAIFAAAFLFIRQSDAFFQNAISEQLLQMAWHSSQAIDADAHAQIQTPADMDSDTYRHLSDYLEDIQQNRTPQFSRVMSAYTIRIRRDGEMIFIVSPPADLNRDGKIEGKLEEREPVALPYGQPPDLAMEAAAVGGVPTANNSFTTDRWGTWLTACAPLRTTTGQLDGAICLDEDASDVRGNMSSVKMGTWGLSTIVIVLFLGLLISYLKARLELEARIVVEQKHRRTLRRFEMAINHAPSVAVQVFDRAGVITLWNQAAEKIFGFSAEEAIGADLATLLFPESAHAEIRKELDRIWVTKKPSGPREQMLLTKSGEVRYTLVTILPIVQDGASVEGFCLHVDISKRMQALQELQTSFERLQALYQMMVGREGRVVELKQEINEMCDRHGEPRRYGV